VAKPDGQRAPRCTACHQDGIYDCTGQVRRAVVRVQFGRAPYGARLCAAHLAMLERSNPPGGVHIVERYN
jgi:hypothetical protein